MASPHCSPHTCLQKHLPDCVAHLNSCLPSPRKAIKCVAAIALSPIKHVQKKHWNAEPEDRVSPVSMQNTLELVNQDNDNVFLDSTGSPPPADYHFGQFHLGSTLETPTAAPAAFKIVGRVPILWTASPSAHSQLLIALPPTC
ncbi:hypothetical protein B0H14DRAFT_2602491 [Mycena olivaceomarginata]|nr:hypothetical protein B0H14DRAFT_2602491 [Mycena olivaceomarginata]